MWIGGDTIPADVSIETKSALDTGGLESSLFAAEPSQGSTNISAEARWHSLSLHTVWAACNGHHAAWARRRRHHIRASWGRGCKASAAPAGNGALPAALAEEEREDIGRDQGSHAATSRKASAALAGDVATPPVLAESSGHLGHASTFQNVREDQRVGSDLEKRLESGVNLGCTLLRQGQAVDALKVLQAVLAQLPKSPKGAAPQKIHCSVALETALRVNLACALQSQPNSEHERRLHLHEALRLQPESVEAHFHLASLEEEAGRLPEALKLLQKAFLLRSDDLNCLALACRCLERSGRHKEALTACERLCGLDPASTFLALREVFRCQPEDVFIVTYPRCGTTWMVQLAVCCLFGPSADYEDHATFLEGSIASSASYVRRIEELPSPRVLKSHVPADMHPGLAHGVGQGMQQHGKVIYVVRNPKDALVSLRHHHANNSSIGWKGSWDEWVEEWVAGRRSEEYGGSYFDHVKGWWQLAKRHPDRVRIVYFEDMKADFAREAADVAKFLGKPLSSEALEKVCQACSFNTMKGRHHVDDSIKGRVNPVHFRQGEVGTWRATLSEDQARKVDQALHHHLHKEISEGLRIRET